MKKLIHELSKIKEIKTITLGGSTSIKSDDEFSDYDIYIYSNSEILPEKRERIIKKISNQYEINNQFYETGDELIAEKVIDIMYRSTNWIEEQIDKVWFNYTPSLGYSTCFIHNVKNSIILYDTDDWFLNLQKKINGEYPDLLSKNIINKNMLILKDKLTASLYEQIKNAISRNDIISINHRLSAFLASYFDIIFAKNKILHPGEKHLINFAIKHCKKLPNNFEQNLKMLLSIPNDNILDNIIKELRICL